jgi:hypothetical protein
MGSDMDLEPTDARRNAIAAAMQSTLKRVVAAAGTGVRRWEQRKRHGRRFARFWGVRPAVLVRPAEVAMPSNTVLAVILAVHRLGPASVRASTSGQPTTVRVPDPHTAELFRAALAETSKIRPSDRLIRVEIEAPVSSAA